MQINGKHHYKSSSPLTLTAGDELIFGSAGKNAYVSFKYYSYLFLFVIVLSFSVANINFILLLIN